ncbi:hypothetical protein [Leptolyngbya sp. GB1-A1]|uniref:hypothetical protein n=1 Tax=unclassified Leptolyngbya TaxID=2650499 RepID=UPI0019AF7D12|nr:hypothetical protein [Cyanobacteria bacterium FACHB-502]
MLRLNNVAFNFKPLPENVPSDRLSHSPNHKGFPNVRSSGDPWTLFYSRVILGLAFWIQRLWVVQPIDRAIHQTGRHDAARHTAHSCCFCRRITVTLKILSPDGIRKNSNWLDER